MTAPSVPPIEESVPGTLVPTRQAFKRVPRGFFVNSTVLRYPAVVTPDEQLIDGTLNFYWVTDSVRPDVKLVRLESGINPLAEVGANKRRPAVLISSSPHRFGAAQTPWQDIYDPDNGWALYFGDNKAPGEPPEQTRGNKVLLYEHARHLSSDRAIRLKAAPLLFFKRIRKGYLQFQGYGVIERVSLVVQLTRSSEPFSNYCYECALFSLAAENEFFDWDWIEKRRDHSVSDNDALAAAPKAWQRWVEKGSDAISQCRRRVATHKVISIKSQRAKDPVVARAVQTIYEYYSDNKHSFEGLAASVVARLLGSTVGKYRHGWVTRRSSDGGIDFVGRLDLGSGLSKMSVVVLGQAKCENPAGATGGIGIARTVARLKRGWIGVHVTTGVFSKHVQQEVIEDQYPLLLVNGSKLATEILTMARERGVTLEELLDHLDELYPDYIQKRRPEDVLSLELLEGWQ